MLDKNTDSEVHADKIEQPPTGTSIAFGLEKIGLIAVRAPVVSCLILVALIIGAIFGIQRIKIDDSLSQLFRSNSKDYKQYEAETNLVLWLLVDVSESMQYRSGEISKFDYACMVAAALAYLTLQQADSVGLVTFDEHIRRFIKPSSQPSHLKEIVHVLNEGTSKQKTSLAPIFHEVADRIPRRVPVPVLRPPLDLCKPTGVELKAGSRIVVMPDKGGVAEALKQALQAKGVEVLVIDPA